MVYGRIDPGVELSIGGYRIRLLRGPLGMLEYRRINGDGEVVSSSYIYHSRDIRIIPARPMILPERNLASCIMIDLDKPIHVPPISSVNVDTSIIVDLAVVVLVKGDYSLVDAFDPGILPKLAFYGQGGEGVLCRYTNGVLEQSTRVGFARTRLSIVNNTGHPVRVSTIVVPLERMRMYYRPGTWDARASDIVMVIRSRDEAVVNVEEPIIDTGMEASPLSYMGREIQLLPTGFSMRWGF